MTQNSSNWQTYYSVPFKLGNTLMTEHFVTASLFVIGILVISTIIFYFYDTQSQFFSYLKNALSNRKPCTEDQTSEKPNSFFDKNYQSKTYKSADNMSSISSFLHPNICISNKDGLSRDEEEDLKCFLGKLNQSFDDSNIEFIKAKGKKNYTAERGNHFAQHF